MNHRTRGGNVTIDEPRPDDAARIAEMFGDDMRELGFSPEPDEMLHVVRSLIKHDGNDVHLLVARDEAGAAIGVVMANTFTSIKYPGPALWIEELYVHPDGRRRGVGTLLVEALLARAHKQGIRGIELEAYRMNTAASVLYRTLGFRRLARERYAFDMEEYEP